MPQSMADIQAEIVEEFSIFDDAMMRYEYIIDLGKKLAPLADVYKTESNVVKGCQSTVWLQSEPQTDGTMRFFADSNTVITKGIIALLVRVMDGQKKADIVNEPLTFIDGINLRGHLSEQRSNGLNAMVDRMRHLASVNEVKS